MTQTLIISMMVVVSGLLFVVMAGQTCLALVLYREAKKLQYPKGVQDALTNLSAHVAALKKDHAALDELVLSWMNRQATRAKRAKKEIEEPEEDEVDLKLFPSLVNEQR